MGTRPRTASGSHRRWGHLEGTWGSSLQGKGSWIQQRPRPHLGPRPHPKAPPTPMKIQLTGWGRPTHMVGNPAHSGKKPRPPAHRTGNTLQRKPCPHQESPAWYHGKAPPTLEAPPTFLEPYAPCPSPVHMATWPHQGGHAHHYGSHAHTPGVTAHRREATPIRLKPRPYQAMPRPHHWKLRPHHIKPYPQEPRGAWQEGQGCSPSRPGRS